MIKDSGETVSGMSVEVAAAAGQVLLALAGDVVIVADGAVLVATEVDVECVVVALGESVVSNALLL